MRYLKPVGSRRAGESCEHINLGLWVDIEKNLKKNMPDFIVIAVKTMADFQRKLHGENARENILKMVREREK